MSSSQDACNMAEIRKALESVRNWCLNRLGNASSQVTVEGLLSVVNAALAAPQRNCDTPYNDQAEMYYAFKDWCKAKGHTMEPMLAYDAFDWLLAPAAERKGEEA